MAPTAATSASNLPQSSTGRLEVSSVLARSYRRITIFSRSSAAVCGNLSIPKSSMISNATPEIERYKIQAAQFLSREGYENAPIGGEHGIARFFDRF